MRRKKLILGIIIVLLAIISIIFVKYQYNNHVTSGKFTVGYLNYSDADPFGNKIKENFEKIGSKDPSVTIKFADGKADVNLQIDQANKFIAEKVDVICINAVDNEAVIPVLEKAKANNITVIAINKSLNNDKYIFVGSKDYEAGVLQGEYMTKILPVNAKILYLEGTHSQISAQERWRGFTDSCLKKRPDIQVLSKIDGNYDKAEGMKIMSVWLQIFPYFDAVIAGNDQMALGAIKAMQSAGRQNVMVSGVDGADEAIKAIKTNEMVQSIKQDAAGQAREAFNVVEMIKNKQAAPKEKIVPFISITKDNVSSY